ncbi:glycosyltransferase family 2 protein [Winogradskyella helgolandensis]|uniref:glycosyltransferase family 2 protein n=1 Tax=Winogradskyella helgolandensis TaxID=2697010 RepID=UPI0015BA1D97|nr:glycosyltransferase family 2 protein [Winogradskyella helgolandensis]
MHPKVSIIIPCYNSEPTLNETLQSIFDQNYDDWEAIMVNDGSPDDLEAVASEWVARDERFKYFKKENGGLASARNYGIKQALGNYILPLDSDNKIKPLYLNKAVSFFEKHAEIDVIYGDAEYFGEKQGVWKVGNYIFEKLLISNYIDACALYKKSIWTKAEGYDEQMPYQGNEDWDFWLRSSVNGAKFFYLEEPCFDYRVSSSSMIHTFNEDMFKSNRDYVRKKYVNEYFKYFKCYKYQLDYYEKHPIRALWKYFKLLFK